MRRLRDAAATTIAALFAVVLPLALAGQTTTSAPPSLLTPSRYGGDLYQHHCASCHGRDGTGGGPAAIALKQAPPDLTTVTRRNGGVFPTARVIWLIGGKDGAPLPAAHGSREMPVWGPIFRALDANPKSAEIRIANLVTFVESMQLK
jgi:mono/diheme cytochrome c family protein